MDETVKPTRLTTAFALLPALTAGLVIGFTAVFFAISMASLVFVAAPAVYLARGIAMMLVTAGGSMIIGALFSSLTGVIISVQDNPAVLLGVAIASIAGAATTPEVFIATVASLIFVTTLLTGIFLYVLGKFELGGLVRYMPYPVIGGFLAGMGWLLVRGSLSTMTGQVLSLETVQIYLQPEHLIQWLPGIGAGLALFIGTRLVRHYLTMPGLLLSGIALFFVVLLLTGTSTTEAMQRGLLMGDLGRAEWQPLPLQGLLEADHLSLLAQVGSIMTIMLLAVIHLLLNISALELMLETDVDLNHELRLLGLVNMFNALAGGTIAYHSLGHTTLGQHLGVRTRWSGIVAGLCCLGVMALSGSLLMYVPRPLVGGVLFFLGLSLLHEWLIRGSQRFNRADFTVVLAILVVIALWGFLVGVAVGLTLMVLIFLINYSRTNIFSHVMTGAERRSKVERPSHSQRALTQLGDHIYILELQGFIFFGTANTLLDQLRRRARQADEKPLWYVVIDFRRVTGLDSSIAFSFIKASHLAKTHGFTLVLTDLAATMQQELVRNGLTLNEQVLVFPDLDHGLEWCEEQLLLRTQITKMRVPTLLVNQLHELGLSKDDARRLKEYLVRVQFESGETLIHQDSEASDMYFIEIGQVSVYMNTIYGPPVRLQTLSIGTVMGELGFYLNNRRTASVVADLHTTAYRLDHAMLEQMQAKDPDLAIAFHKLMVQFVAERLVHANQEVAALTR